MEEQRMGVFLGLTHIQRTTFILFHNRILCGGWYRCLALLVNPSQFSYLGMLFINFPLSPSLFLPLYFKINSNISSVGSVQVIKSCRSNDRRNIYFGQKIPFKRVYWCLPSCYWFAHIHIGRYPMYKLLPVSFPFTFGLTPLQYFYSCRYKTLTGSQSSRNRFSSFFTRHELA